MDVYSTSSDEGGEVVSKKRRLHESGSSAAKSSSGKIEIQVSGGNVRLVDPNGVRVMIPWGELDDFISQLQKVRRQHASSQPSSQAMANAGGELAAAAPAPPATDSVSSAQQPAEPLKEDEFVDLGKNIRLSTSVFRGRRNVQVREYYNAGGEMKPGMKGMALNEFGWKALLRQLPEVFEKMEAREEATLKPLETGKHLAVTLFSGTARMDLRNYYENKELGTFLPTKKGITLTIDQVKKLSESANRIVF